MNVWWETYKVYVVYLCIVFLSVDIIWFLSHWFLKYIDATNRYSDGNKENDKLFSYIWFVKNSLIFIQRNYLKGGTSSANHSLKHSPYLPKYPHFLLPISRLVKCIMGGDK